MSRPRPRGPVRLAVTVRPADDAIDLDAWLARYVGALLRAEGVAPARDAA